MNNNSHNFKPVKDYNKYLILDLIRTKGPISRVQLAALTGLSTAAISIITNDLLEKGFIHETGVGKSQQGRKPILIEIIPESMYIIGIDIGHVSIRTCIANLSQQIVERREYAFDLHDRYEELSSKVIGLALDLVNFAKEKDYLISGIGIVMPGTLIVPGPMAEAGAENQQRKGVDWKSLSLKSDIEQATGLQAFLANATDAAALAESLFGRAREVNRLVFVTIGSGVKAGIVMPDSFDIDELGYTPEFGHTTIDINGEECWCGNIGCLETYISESAILTFAHQAIQKHPDSHLAAISGHNRDDLQVNQIFMAAKTGDKAAQETFDHLVRYLGAGVVSLVNLYAPDLILIGAREMKMDHLDMLIDPLEKIVQKYAMPLPAKRVSIDVGSFSEDTYLMGALSIVVREIFSPFGEISILESD